jgi:hypothetical protein
MLDQRDLRPVYARLRAEQPSTTGVTSKSRAKTVRGKRGP